MSDTQVAIGISIAVGLLGARAAYRLPAVCGQRIERAWIVGLVSTVVAWFVGSVMLALR